MTITTYKPIASTRASKAFTDSPLFDVTERIGYISTTTVFDEQEITTQTPFPCGFGSRDIRCRQSQNFETTETIETTTYPNSIQLDKTKSDGFDSFCDRYPNSKRCKQRVNDDLGSNIEIITFRPPVPFSTIKSQITTTDTPTTSLPSTTLATICARNPNDYRCKQNEFIQTTVAFQVDEQPFDCDGNSLDPRCPNPMTTDAPTYLPAITTRKTIGPRIEASTSPTTTGATKKQTVTRQPIPKKTTKKFFICVPGSNDVNCDYEAKKDENEQSVDVKTTQIPSQSQYTTKQPIEKPICVPGSRNPECQKVSTDIITLKPTLSTVKPPTAFTPRAYGQTKKPAFKPLSTTTNKYIASEIPVIVVQEECYPGKNFFCYKFANC